MAIMARWRMPPGELVRVHRRPLAGLGDADEVEHLDGPLEGRAALERPRGSRAISPIWRPTVCTGFSAVSGSWKIMAISPPRTWRRSLLGDREQVVALPEDLAPVRPPGSGCRPRMAIAVTDLPEPDSPTMANTSPRWTSNETPSTACTTPSSVSKHGARGRATGAASVGRVEASLELRVQCVAQAVADEDEGEDGEEDGAAREEQQVRGRLADGPCPVRPSGPTPASGPAGPTPRNDSAASARITEPTAIVP